jgi:hypothetical protein
MTMNNPNLPPFPRRLLAGSLAFGLPAFLAACAGHSPRAERMATILDLDSLNRVVEHNDSVEANFFFYEDAFAAYKAEYPGVDKPSYMGVARGKDTFFCLFQPDPGRLCADVGDKFRSLGLEEPARDAYEAGLLSEGVNGDALNIRLWTGMARLHLGWGDNDRAKVYLTKVLEVDGQNQWARKMETCPAGATAAADTAKKPEVVRSYPGRAGAAKRQAKRQVRARERAGRAASRGTVRNGRGGALERESGLARIPLRADRGAPSARDAALD